MRAEQPVHGRARSRRRPRRRVPRPACGSGSRRERAVASLERGSRMRARIMAVARARSREGRRSRSFSRPRRRAVPSTAAAWPAEDGEGSPREGSATPPEQDAEPLARSSGLRQVAARVRSCRLRGRTRAAARRAGSSHAFGGKLSLSVRRPGFRWKLGLVQPVSPAAAGASPDRGSRSRLRPPPGPARPSRRAPVP